MHVTQQIRCPNCGKLAERHQLSGIDGADSGCPESRVTRIECASCDYFMVTCALNGNVVEAYSPGVYTFQEPHLWQREYAKTWDNLPPLPKQKPLTGPVGR